MRFFILRHADAERDSSTGRDEDRVLSAVGVAKSQELAARLGSDAIFRADPIHRLMVSPAIRAQQTVEPIALATGVRVETEVRLGPERSVQDSIEVVQELLARGMNTMLVGHNPTASRLVAWLGGRDDSMSTCELVLIDVVEVAPRLVGREVGRLGSGN